MGRYFFGGGLKGNGLEGMDWFGRLEGVGLVGRSWIGWKELD